MTNSHLPSSAGSAVLREDIAKTIWLAEYRRATGKERSITWYDVAEDDRRKYLFVADAIAALITDVAQGAQVREEDILAMALIINPFADELDDRDGGKLFDAARRLWTAGYRKSGGGLAVGVPAAMQESNDRGLAQDAERPEDTTQGDRPAHPVTCPPETAHPRSSADTVQVRPLEWDEGKGELNGQLVWSSGDPWVFWIVKNPDSNYIWCENFNIDGFVPASPVRGSYDTLDEAKAAAQADYDERIRAAVILTQPQRVPDSYALVPRELTAENGAKALLIGEFNEEFGLLDEDGNEQYAKVAVTWTTIKEIHKKMVAHFSPALTRPELGSAE